MLQFGSKTFEVDGVTVFADHEDQNQFWYLASEVALGQRRSDGRPAFTFIKYKPAAYQKITQQTCKPSEVEVKGPKTRGRQISIKDVSSINSKPSRGWDPEAATTKLQFA